MKKSIQALMSKLQVADDGKVTGGFTSIKGGYSAFVIAQNNGTCDNAKGSTCSGTNSATCTNSGDCSKATNSVPSSCTNSGTCSA